MDDIKNTLLKLSKTVTKTSGDLLKTTKLSVSLSTEEEALKNLYIEIGKKVHEIYLYGGSLGKFFDEKYKELEAQEAKIKSLRDDLDEVKGTKTCPKCGKTVDKTAEFCSKCGFSMVGVPPSSAAKREMPAPIEPESIKPPAADPVPHAQTVTEPEQKPEKIKCRLCGALNEPGSKFCLSCGRMI